MKWREVINKLKLKLSDRITIFQIIVILMFVVIGYQFYKLQIIDHHKYTEELLATVQKEVDVPAIRGEIYDRYGKPLAVNKGIYTIKYNPEVQFRKTVERDAVLLKLADLLEENGDEYIDNIPISKTPPFVFTEDKNSVRRFITNYLPYKNTEHKMTLYELTAPELMDYMKEQLMPYLENTEKLEPSQRFSDEQARKILAMKLEIRRTSYEKYKLVTLAENISTKSIAVIEEHHKEFASIIPEMESQRYYTYGKCMGNILGYTRHITDSQFETLKDEGYDKDDIVGQVGIESQMESELRGKKGSKRIQVDNEGRTVFTLETAQAMMGNNIYLTIDAELQQEVYNALEKRLSEAIVTRLKGGNKTIPLKGRDILISMAKNNQLDFKQMSAAADGTMQKQLYNKVMDSYQKLEDTDLSIKEHFAEMLDSETALITNEELIVAFAEQGSLKLDEGQINNVRNGRYSLDSLLINQFETGGLKPDQMNITPCSGTAVVIDPSTGQTLALVSYPSYDNNDFIQNFNSFYTKLHDGVDDRNIEINRALKTAKAPGSTFKMITGVAGLEEGVITPSTQIYDTGQYTKAGSPYVKCWIYSNTGSGHGNEDIVGAFEVSCNYFFNDVAYRLGLKYGAPYGAISKLTEYAEKFGLGQKTGIELEEAAPNISNPTNLVTTQTARALNGIKKMDSDDKEKLYAEIREYIGSGFYPRGDKYATDVEGQIDFLSHDYLQGPINEQLSMVLDNNISTICDKMLEDFSEELEGVVSDSAKIIAETVMAGDQSLTLKYRTKYAISNFLTQIVQSGTRKSIKKSFAQIPDDTLKQIYIEAYTNTLEDIANDTDKNQIKTVLNERIKGLKDGTFDPEELLTDKVIEKILAIYLDDYFQNVDLEWTTAINVRTAMGQGQNTFTPVQLARYTAALVNGKTVYDLTIISGIKDNKSSGLYEKNEPKVFNELNFKPSTIESIHKGMLAVTTGAHGTATKYFSDFPMKIALKTGTAQETNCENSWVSSFGPYENPQIAVVTSMYGTDGLGSYTYEFAKDVYSIYFKMDKEEKTETFGNHLEY